MKYLSIISALLLFSFSTWSQQIITGKVFDAYSQTPIEGVKVIYGQNQGVITNEEGNFTVPCSGETKLKFTHSSYETWEGTILFCNPNLQVGLIPSVVNLNGVEITANSSSNKKMLEQPQSISTISRRDLQRNSGLFLEESINLESGIRMEKRTMSGGQRITIRGYGNNTNFNGMGYKAYLNGIPITDATGTTILDDIDFSTLGKVEVIKGPASSLYGSGIGGVLNMYSLKPKAQQTSVSQELIAGSYGLFRSNTRLETATDKSSVLLNYGNQNYDGYRVHSKSKKNYVTFTGDFRPSDKQVLTTYLSYNNSYEELAGQLDSAQFANRENVAEKNYLDNDGHVGIESLRTGLSHRYNFSKNFSNLTSGFLSSYTLNQAYASGLNENSTQNFGGRTEFQYNYKGKSIGIHGILGGEFQKSVGNYRGYALTAGVLGDHRSDNSINTMQYNLFTEWNIELPKAFTLIAGASANFLEYDITDHLTNTSNPTHKDASGYKSFAPVMTPRVALQKVFNKNISAYVSASSGYSPPTTSDAVITYTGEVNDGLKPEMGIQYEIGTKGSVLDNKLSWQVAVFNLNVNNKLTSRAVTDSLGSVLYSYTVNGGDQSNKGLELSISYLPINDASKVISYVRPFATFTYSKFEYTSFKSDANNDANTIDYAGNTVIGTPPVMFNAGIDLATKWGVYLNSSFQYVDEMFITFDNLHSAPDYTLLAGKIGYKTELGKHFFLDVFAGGNNLTNSTYYNMVFINWQKGPQPSIYSPGSYTSTFYGGFNLKYTI